MKANRLFLNKRCEFWHDATNAAVPMAQCPASQLAAVLDSLGGDSVTVEFNTTTDPAEVGADLRKYDKRLAAVSHGWDRSEFAPKIVRGIEVSAVMSCTLTRRSS